MGNGSGTAMVHRLDLHGAIRVLDELGLVIRLDG